MLEVPPTSSTSLGGFTLARPSCKVVDHIVADRTEEDGRLCLWSWVHLVQELRGDGEAGARAAHREEEVVVGVGALHGDGLVLVSAVMTILSIV